MVACHSSNESAFNKQQHNLNMGASRQYGYKVMAVFLQACARQLNILIVSAD